MAKTLEAFPSAGSQPKYPWEEWLNGEIWALERGADFSSRPETVRANAQLQARKRGGTVRSRKLKDGDTETVVLQFIRN